MEQGLAMNCMSCSLSFDLHSHLPFRMACDHSGNPPSYQLAASASARSSPLTAPNLNGGSLWSVGSAADTPTLITSNPLRTKPSSEPSARPRLAPPPSFPLELNGLISPPHSSSPRPKALNYLRSETTSVSSTPSPLLRARVNWTL